MLPLNKKMTSFDLSKHTEYLCEYGRFGTPYFQCLYCSYWSYSHLQMRKHLKNHPWVAEESVVDYLLKWRETRLESVLQEICEFVDTTTGKIYRLNNDLMYQQKDTSNGILSFPSRHLLYGTAVFLIWKACENGENTDEYEFDSWYAKFKDGTYFF
jgi:hypothetical protein